MARLVNAFNAANFDPSQGMGGLPVGEHLVIAYASEVKPTKGGDSGFLQLNLRITEGNNQGQSGALRLNIYNSSDQAREIAERQLSAVCHAVGVINIEDSQQLHNLPFRVEVGMQKEPNPNKYTEIKRILCADGSEPKMGGNGGNNANQNNGFNSQNQNNNQNNNQQNQGNNNNNNNNNQNNGNGNAGYGGNTNADNGNNGNQSGGWNQNNGNGNGNGNGNNNQGQDNQNQNNGNGNNGNNGNNNGGGNGGGWNQNNGNNNGGGDSKPGWGR